MGGTTAGRQADDAVRWRPETPPAERTLHDRLAATVGERVTLLPQVMLSVADHGRLEEVEADLVIIDPDHGVVVVEVKGGTVGYDAARAVWRRRERGMAVIRDPVQQVKRARSTIRRHLKAQRVPVDQVPIRWVVATPECTLDSPGEGLLPSHLIWDASALNDPAAALAGTQGRMVHGEQPIGADRARLIARALRGRDVQGLPSLVGEVLDHEGRVRAHTDSHRLVMYRFLAHRRVLVRGAAGTGKTMLAIEAASLFASQGQRVLLTCWHRLLADALRRMLRARLEDIGSPRASEVTADPGGPVVVSDLAGLAGDRGPPSGVAHRDWYYDRLPEQLTEAHTGGRFDAIVLDEAQDPNEWWLLALNGLLADEGRWYAFADKQQNLFGTSPGLKDFVEVEQELNENLRHTRQIADFAALFGQVETDCLTGEGPPVELRRVAADRVVDRVTEIARKLCRDEGYQPGDVAALWLFHNPLQGDPDALIAQDVRREMVTTNSAAFKGLERPVVVLGLDVRPERTPEELQRTIYAAATRARSRLVVLGDPDALRRAQLYRLAAMFPTPS